MAAPIAFGRYVLLDQLATGGMAEIFLARDTGGGGHQTCVIKRVLPHLAANTDFLEMFLDEARIAARLHHPGIVQILDLGRQGDDYFFAMEYLPGEDTSAIAFRCKQLGRSVPVDVAMRIASSAADALHHAHELKDGGGHALNVVHRDVSPSNIFVTYDGEVKLLDFGIARAEQRLYETRAGQIKGKAAYMSPEQARGKPVDRRADVWSLAVCLHELIRGELLFARETWLETLDALRAGSIPPLREWRPDVPVELDQLLQRAFERDVDRRLATAAEFHEGLERLLAASTAPPDIGAFLTEAFGRERAEARLHLSAMVEAIPAERVATADILLPTEFGTADRSPSEPSGPGARTPVDEQRERRGASPRGSTEVIEDDAPTGSVPELTAERVAQAMAYRPDTERSAVNTAPGVVRRWWWMGALVGIATTAGAAALLGLFRQESPPVAVTLRPQVIDAPKVPPALPVPPPPAPPSPPQEQLQPAPPPPPVQRSKIKVAEERHPRASASSMGYLSLDANEPMNVWVDGAAVGTLPIKRLRLAAGEHRVKLDNHLLGLSRVVRLGLKPGEDLAHRETFQKGKLNVSTQPWADVFVDGKKLGTTPLAAREVWEGRHSVRLVGPDGEKTVTVDVVPGQTAVIKEKFP